MSSWLDTETKALLEKVPPDKLAPAGTVAFTLVLLSKVRSVESRLVRAVQRILLAPREQAEQCLRNEVPCCIKSGLTHSDALLGQFELICCDVQSVFIKDEIARGATSKYLHELYQTLMQSDEFMQTPIRIESLPSDERAEAFIDQFLEVYPQTYPVHVIVPRKKARIMHHWATKIGGEITVFGG